MKTDYIKGIVWFCVKYTKLYIVKYTLKQNNDIQNSEKKYTKSFTCCKFSYICNGSVLNIHKSNLLTGYTGLDRILSIL